MKKIILFTFIILFITGCTQPNKQSDKVTLEYWGVYEPLANMQEIINEYQTANPNVTINYTRKGLKEYKQQIIARTGKENGPDIFRFHNSWVPELRPYLSITPQTTQSALDFKTIFYPVVSTDLQANRGYYGVPLMYDGLGLYYNKQLFRERGLISPPETWKDVIESAKQLRAPASGKLEISGIAMGSTENIENWSDIFGLLMYQQNASLSSPQSTKEETETAINFYKQFITEHRVWDESTINSVEAFAQGKLAMMFGTSWTAFDIQAKNRDLEFAVAPVPQIPGTKIGIASYWVEGVSKSSTTAEQTESWKFITHLASKDIQQRLYAIQGATRLFGQPPSRTDLADEVKSNQYFGGILETAPSARSLYISDKTFGGGLNQELIDLYKLLINNNDKAAPGIERLYIEYNIPKQ